MGYLLSFYCVCVMLDAVAFGILVSLPMERRHNLRRNPATRSIRSKIPCRPTAARMTSNFSRSAILLLLLLLLMQSITVNIRTARQT